MLRKSRAAVLDLNHGGIIIARKLKKIAGSVTCIDVYNTLSTEAFYDLEKEGIKISRDPLPVKDFDVLIAPIHLDPGYPMLIDALKNNVPVLSHHKAVGEILCDLYPNNMTTIEITGTKAKTSTSILLAGILSLNKKVISQTSRGVEDWGSRRTIKKGLSITPASIISALDAAREEGIRPDVFIFEISLGGTGFADIGVITTITNDYLIANNTKSASEAKRQMILNARSGSILVINHDALRSFGACRRDVRIISFSDSVNAACNVYYEDAGVIAYHINKKQGRITIHENPDYDISSYKTAFVCAAAIALAMDIEPEIIEHTFRKFRGAQGRMRKTTFSGRVMIDNSNSGMDIRNAEKALDYSKASGDNVVMVLGEEAKEVCEGLDPSGVERFIDRRLDELQALVLVGERMKPLVQKNTDKIHHANDLSKGIELAAQLAKENDIILSCVKCFR